MFYILFYCYRHRFCRHRVSLTLGRHNLIVVRPDRDLGMHILGK